SPMNPMRPSTSFCSGGGEVFDSDPLRFSGNGCAETGRKTDSWSGICVSHAVETSAVDACGKLMCLRRRPLAGNCRNSTVLAVIRIRGERGGRRSRLKGQLAKLACQQTQRDHGKPSVNGAISHKRRH